MKWTQHSPVFESDQLNPEMIKYSPWSGHRLFAYDYVAYECPKCIVELGSFYGCSSFAFLQAVKDYKLNTSFYAIDTWQGDVFTEQDYREDIYGEFQKIREVCFSGQNINSMRMTFDDAVQYFDDCSIDLLHIDGSHIYEDVKHDFNTWKRKVKPGGAIFFHDVGTDLLEGKVLGSHVFWEELKQIYAYTLEFPFSFGLGVLFFERDKYERIKQAADMDYYQQQANYSAVLFKDVIRKQYFEIRSLQQFINSLKAQVEGDQQQLASYKKHEREKNRYIDELQSVRDSISSDYEKTLEGKDTYIKELEDTVAQYQSTEKTRTSYISELEQQIKELQFKIHQLMNDIKRINSEYKANLLNYQKDLAAKEEYIDQYSKDSKKNDKYVKELKTALKQFEDSSRERNEYIAKLETQIKELQETICQLMSDIERINGDYGKNIDIYKQSDRKKTEYITELKETIAAYQKTVQGKDDYINELEEAIQHYQKDEQDRVEYIEQLETEVQKLHKTIDGLMSDVSKINAEYDINLQRYKTASDAKARYIEELLTRVNSHLADIEEKEACIKSLQERMSALAEKYKDSQTRNSALAVQIKELNQVIEHLKNEISLKDREENREIARLGTDLRRAMLSAKDDQERIDHLQRQLLQTQQQLKALKQTVLKMPFGKQLIKKMEM